MLSIELQWAIEEQATPSFEQCQIWVQTVLDALKDDNETELTIRIVDETEIQTLNRDYRGKDKPTNVLSFPFENPPGLADFNENIPYLGDLAICASVVEKEARVQCKSLEAHWAHMIIHGTLHLLGYDHIEDAEAEEMEALEIKVLEQLAFCNPYQIEQENCE